MTTNQRSRRRDVRPVLLNDASPVYTFQSYHDLSVSTTTHGRCVHAKVVINRGARFHTRRKLAAMESRPTSGYSWPLCARKVVINRGTRFHTRRKLAAMESRPTSIGLDNYSWPLQARLPRWLTLTLAPLRAIVTLANERNGCQGSVCDRSRDAAPDGLTE